MLCAVYIPYFYLAMYVTQAFCVLKIINSEENPDYKIPWLLFVLIVLVAGFMIYFMFYNRMLDKKQIKRIEKINSQQVHTKDEKTLEKLEQEDRRAYLQANLLCGLANTHVYQNTTARYYDMGEKLFPAMLEDMKKAEKFIFLVDYELNVKTPVSEFNPYFWNGCSMENEGYMIPFGDGPRPMFKHRVAKIMLMNMLNQAQEYVYMMSPYLIIDNELCQAIENAAMRGIDVRIITPHIPDKKIVFVMTRSHYKRLTDAGVKIYEFEPGFVHAKVYISDDKYAIVGTINLDYRSLVHHFENGVWLYKHEVLEQIKADMIGTMKQSIKMTDKMIKNTLGQRFIRAVVRALSPML